MKIDIRKITEGEENIVIRYIEPNPSVERIVGILSGQGGRLWGKADGQSVSIDPDAILYLESVDDAVFAYTADRVLRMEGSLSSFMSEWADESFFRCSRSMVININRVVSLKSLSSNRIDATMEGGEHIIISRRYASEFRRILKGDR
ncbi:MAG: LytTR family transcriptional regulator DNA-binding domain-containing protein [Lachnospiraceae bacterium]|nr:LytTR family transcriptional regulator DNA-binding domain-containing protein [Lachnospiraceae bacterium]